MNIFVLDDNLDRSAQMLADQHLNKQILELAQILCTVAHKNGIAAPYRATHGNHPVTIWAANNIDICINYAAALHREFKYRFKKDHRSYAVIKSLQLPHINLNTTFPIPNSITLLQSKYSEWLTRERPITPKWTNRITPSIFK